MTATNSRTLSKVLIGAAILVFMALAVLHYRWSTQINEATSARLADSLQMTMSNWQLNFFRDVSDVAAALRVDSEFSGNLDLYARRFKEWKATARYKEAASDLFVIKPEGGTPETLRLDLDSYKFKPSEWPGELASLKESLKRTQAHPRTAGGFFPRGLAGWRFDPTTLAIARPIESLAGTWLVVKLEMEPIRSQILPDLAKRHFMGVDEFDYSIAVVSAPEPFQVLYSTDGDFGSVDVPDADGRMDIFGSVIAQRYGAPLHVFHPLSDERLLGNSGSPQWFPLLDEGSEHGWQLIVRHRRGGPLGAFVTDMRRRDLLISFGTLFLLVAIVATLVVASFRANRLAKLQMDFVTTVSHELRSPLAVIGSAAENITHGVVDSREQLMRYAKVIEGQTRQLTRLVEEVLLFAGTRENRQRFNLRSISVSDLIESTLAGAADLIEASRATISKEIPESLPQVRGDLAALSHCLQNLVANALKYGGDQRWIGISAVVGEDAAGRKEVRIAVADRGIGIDPRELPHIFEPFYRGASATAAQIHGTGLGLSLAKNIAEAMQGRITVESRQGTGSTFTLHLPAA